MDDDLAKGVTDAFVRLFDKGLIYRAERLVNWDCVLQTAISDAEVEYQQLDGKTSIEVPHPDGGKRKYVFGVLDRFFYQIADSEGKPTDERILIATTRLETMLGDTAVANHSQDARYKHLHGKQVFHPFRKCTIPIICDDKLVDMEFGTGAVKVTPAHDPDDFDCAKRNGLPFLDIFTEDGRINENGAPFTKMPRLDARKAVLEELTKMGLYEGQVPNKMRLGLTQRSGDVAEQLLRPQWFVDTREMARRALSVVETGELEILPKEFEVDWRRWHESIRPWCISRQLWWGHRVPAYRVFVKGESTEKWVAGHDDAEALKRAQEIDADASIVQDEDVLDTWFSSGLLPFTVLYRGDDLSKYFPGSVLETGWDILTFWVSRMVMLSLELMDSIPFKRVFLHPLIRDALGRKMSKSLGNVVDPLHVKNGISLDQLIQNLSTAGFGERELAIATKGMREMFPEGIPQCGTDGMRLALCAFAGVGRNAPLAVNQIVTYRNFCNKLWNAVRFARPNLPTEATSWSETDLTVPDRWILSRLASAIEKVHEGFEKFTGADAVAQSIHFFHDEFCSIYLESIKPIMKSESPHKATVSAILYDVIETFLRLIHPFMPFVTEDLWQRLPRRFAVESIMIAPFPEQGRLRWETPEIEEAMLCVNGLRAIKTGYNLRSSDCEVEIVTESEGVAAQFEFVRALALVGPIRRAAAGTRTPGWSTKVVSPSSEVRLKVAGQINVEKELQGALQKKAKVEPAVEKLRGKIDGPGYDRVPQKVQDGERARLAELQQELDAIVAQISDLEALQAGS